jgi:hypothetical protein
VEIYGDDGLRHGREVIKMELGGRHPAAPAGADQGSEYDVDSTPW